MWIRPRLAEVGSNIARVGKSGLKGAMGQKFRLLENIFKLARLVIGEGIHFRPNNKIIKDDKFCTIKIFMV